MVPRHENEVRIISSTRSDVGQVERQRDGRRFGHSGAAMQAGQVEGPLARRGRLEAFHGSEMARGVMDDGLVRTGQKYPTLEWNYRNGSPIKDYAGKGRPAAASTANPRDRAGREGTPVAPSCFPNNPV